MKTVATFSKPEDAHLLRAHLEGNGIAAFVRDDETVSTDWALSNAIGGVKVDVADEDQAAATAFVSAFTTRHAGAAGPGKKKHGFDRYLKLFAIVLPVSFAFLAFKIHPAPAEAYGGVLMASVAVAFCVATFFAVFDL
jgi:hypothetical protein